MGPFFRIFSVGRWNSSGGPSSSQQDLCEVSGHDHSLTLSFRFLTLLVCGFCLANLGLWKAAQVRREHWFCPSILWKNLCASTSAVLQVPSLQRPRQDCVQRILWTWTRWVTSPPLLIFSPPITDSTEMPFSRVTRTHVWNVGGNPKRLGTYAWDVITPSES